MENVIFLSTYSIMATSSKEEDRTSLLTHSRRIPNTLDTSVMTPSHCHCQLILPTLTWSPGQALHQSQSSSQSHNTEIPAKTKTNRINNRVNFDIIRAPEFSSKFEGRVYNLKSTTTSYAYFEKRLQSKRNPRVSPSKGLDTP